LQKLRSSSLHKLLMLFVTVLTIAAATIVWAGPKPGPGGRNDNDKDYKKGFQSRNDDDWDDHDNFHRRERYAIGLWGDLPYSDVQAAAVENLILDMNSQDLAFTAHDGDLKAGKSTPGSVTVTQCTDAKYLQFHDPVNLNGFFDQLKAPAIFTPGDNDWVDCDNTGTTTNGPFNSLERLDHERALFFSTSHTLGQHHLQQAVQGVTPGVDATPCTGFVHGIGTLDVNGNGLDTDVRKNVACVENRRWTYRGVTYATLDVQGSCDNRCKDHPDPIEAAGRQAAVVAWMRETFKVAKDRDSAAIMFILQADVGFGNRPVESEPNRDPKTLVCNTTGTNACTASTPDGFYAFLTALRDEAKTFPKPVAYVHGDSHYFRIDKPLYDLNPPDPPSSGSVPVGSSVTARRLENFIRIETFGDNTFVEATADTNNDKNNVHWVKVFVDPDSREVFSFQPQIVPANRVVVPAN
jgi:hypothetical protein